MIVCMILATAILVFYFLLFLTAGKKETEALLQALLDNNEEETQKNKVEIARLIARSKADPEKTDKKMQKQAQKLQKKDALLKEQKAQLEAGSIGLKDLLILPGYRMLVLLRWDASNGIVEDLRRRCEQFMERKEAMNRSYYLLANLISLIILGAGFGLLVGVILTAMGREVLSSAAIGFVVFGLLSIVGYLPYSNVNVIIRERKEAIENQFPQVVSKLTLLVTAGLEVRQAWELTCVGDGILYDEMSRVLLDLNNNVSTANAYGRFLKRCNNPYVTKLSTAIIQNTTQGNEKIAAVFRSLNDESWLEYKHSARRMGESVQSKLLIPTVLMFLGILILIIVPMVTGFNI